MNLSEHLFSTYSIVAHDAENGQLGAAVQTHQMCVGSRVLWLVPGVGAMATQSLANFSFGPMALAMLREGTEPARVIDALVATDADAHRRQIGIVDANGRVGAWTGSGCIREASHRTGVGYSVQANMMTHPSVVPVMAQAFETTSGDLAQRMMAAMEAAQSEGGDIRGMQSAALKVVAGDKNGPEWQIIYDLRVDEHVDPVKELARLVRLRNSQIINNLGYEALKNNQRDKALELWTQARVQAPELEETAFWQAVTLADEHSDIETAVAILRPVLDYDARRDHWLDLIQRLAECGLLEREKSGEELLAALSS